MRREGRCICKWLSNTSLINFMLFLACTMLRILIHLWGLCIFLYCCYYWHDNNDITDIIVFLWFKRQKILGQSTWMLVKNRFVLVYIEEHFSKVVFHTFCFAHISNIKIWFSGLLNLYVMIKFYFISYSNVRECFISTQLVFPRIVQWLLKKDMRTN